MAQKKGSGKTIATIPEPNRNHPMKKLLAIASRYQERAFKIIENLGLVSIWEAQGAEVRLVGSLKTGLLIKKRDIDLHVYSDPLQIAASFAAMAKLAEQPGITRIEYGNLLHTEENCIEWHAWYRDSDEKVWQIDMIHILKGSFYDGYFEKMAERILRVMTPEMKQTVLQLKMETPDTEAIAGIAYYQAVIRDGVKSYAEFTKWRKRHPMNGILDWMP